MALLALGTGLGLSAISPWSNKGLQASTFGFSSIVWVIVTQLCASALGGYLAGRLRTRWTAVHADEVYFRDTAHGLLSWAVASLAVAALLLSAASSVVEGAAKTTALAATQAATVGAATLSNADDHSNATGAPPRHGNEPMGYLIDTLFRKDATAPAAPATAASDAAPTDSSRMPVGEVTRIYANALRSGALTPQDTHYLGQLIAQRTGLAQPDAERRASEAYTTLQTYANNAKTEAATAAEKARKLGIWISLWLFIALLSGAFVACYAAMLGGRERDAR